jgi:hypothetical protein
MTSRTAVPYQTGLSIAPTLTLLATTFALYLGVVYIFSFSMQTPSARYAINSAILIMNALIAAQFVTARLRVRSGSHLHSGPRLQFDSACWAAGYGLLLCVILLQADYMVARYRYAAAGFTGSLEIIKVFVLASQLLYVVAVALLTSRPQSARTLLAYLKPDAGDALLLSVVLVPLVHYLAYNSALFTFVSAAGYLAFFLLCPLAAVLVVQCLQRALNAPAIAAPLVAGLALVYYSMPVVSAALKRPVDTLFWVQAGLALTIPAVLVTMYRVDGKFIARAIALYAAFSMAVSVIQAKFTGQRTREGEVAASLENYITAQTELGKLLSGTVKRRPDVYLLVYDSLSPSAMMAHYGIDDRGDTEYLIGHGFKIYDDSYSLFALSKLSMSSVLDMRRTPHSVVGGHTTAVKFLRQHGYKTHLILNSYLLQGAEPTAVDVMFPSFRGRWDLAALYRGIAGGQFKPELVFLDSDRTEWLSAKRSVLTAPAGPPRMLYAHSMLPGHSDQSGNCLPNETALYEARLGKARTEMRGDIESILSSHRDAVIIVAGDHGPYLTGDCSYLTGYAEAQLTAVHLADRYGVRLAIRWPEKISAGIDRIKVLQDVLFGVSAYLLDDDRIWSQRPSMETVGMLNIPDGAINDGVVTIGPDKGSPLLKR